LVITELLTFPDPLKYRIFREPVIRRNYVKGPGKLVFAHLGKTGKGQRVFYFFFNKKRNTVKALYYGEHAINVIQIEPESITFTLPGFERDRKTNDLNPVTLMMLIQDMKLTAKRRA
jgi:hypothetical protein